VNDAGAATEWISEEKFEEGKREEVAEVQCNYFVRVSGKFLVLNMVYNDP
jgi:hypothetical protein